MTAETARKQGGRAVPRSQGNARGTGNGGCAAGTVSPVGGDRFRHRGTQPHQSAWLAEKKTASKRAAVAHTCRRCNQPVLTGDSHDDCSTRITVDANPATWLAEIAAHLQHRHSALLIAGCLHMRDPSAKTRKPQYPIHLFHQCGTNKETGALF